MCSPLRVMVRRLPGPAPARLLTSLPKAAAAFSTGRPICLAQPSRRQPCAQASMPRTFSRANHDLASSARKVPDANLNKTAADMATPPAAPTINWDTFFRLRLRRRQVQLVFSVVTGITGLGTGAGVLSTGVAEPLVAQIPLDPFATLAIMTIASGAFGWLVGPTVGAQLFYMFQGKLAGQIRQKESQFLTRVKQHRADPSNSSAGNPVPDYYGEKIQSVAGYRQWLKDQRAFNKKKTQAFV